MRLFVAIELPDAWRDTAREARAAIESAARVESGALRWVRPELLHLTLRFVGEVADETVERLRASLDREVGVLDLQLTSAGLGVYGARRRIQVVWLGVGGDLDGLRALAGRVDRACLDAGVPPQRGPYSPHVTLARVRERTSSDVRVAIAAAVDRLELQDAMGLRVRDVALVRSFLGDGAPRYEVLSRHPPPTSE